MNRPILFLLLVTHAHAGGAAAATNYCHDHQVNSEWDRMVDLAPADTETRYLRDLRSTICDRIDSGGMTVEEGTRLFERERNEIVKNRLPAA